MTVTINELEEFVHEITVKLRNADIFTTTQRGVTTTTEEFDGDGNEDTFTLSNTPVQNVRSVTVDAAAQTFGVHYTVDYANAQVIFTSGNEPGSGTDNVDIQYDYATSSGAPNEKIYPSFPKRLLPLSKFPRISFDITNVRTQVIAMGGGATRNIAFIDLAIDHTEPRSYIDSVRQFILDNSKNFYYSYFVTTLGFRVLPNAQGNSGQEILRAVIEIQAEFEEEV